MRWPWARKSHYEDYLKELERDYDKVCAERDELRERVERRSRPLTMALSDRSGKPGDETHPGMFPPDDPGTVLWEQHPGADQVWIPVGPFTLKGKAYDEGYVLAHRPASWGRDPRPEEPVTLWEGFDLVERPDDGPWGRYGDSEAPT